MVLFGRRRIGKTETLKQFCKDKPHVFYSCTECTDPIQLRKFSERMLRENIPAKQYVSVFSDWEMAFRAVLELPYGEHKRLLIIDEFPYMCFRNASIPSILQNLWDECFKDENIMIVLCGSAMSFIEKELLAEKNPLYGRATGIYKMKQMGFYDAMQFFPNYSPMDKVLSYSILGGVPHYLRQFDPDLTVAENVKKHILAKGCALYSEVDFLLHQELRETSIYNAIIEAVAAGSTRLNEISQRTLLQDNSKTSVYLKNLLELGIVEREFSVDSSLKEQPTGIRGIYRLMDNFFRFWYAFGFGNYSQLENGDAAGIWKYVVEPELHIFASYTFEDICREFVQELQKKNMLPFRYYKMGRWMGKTTLRSKEPQGKVVSAETEIDILAISRDAKRYMVGECKFKNSPFRYSEYLETQAKLVPQKQSAQFDYALFLINLTNAQRESTRLFSRRNTYGR